MWGGVWDWRGRAAQARQGCRGASCRSISIDPHPVLVLQCPKFHFFFKSDERGNRVCMAPGLEMAADLSP